jgi:HD domain
MTALLGDIGTIEWCRRTNGILGRGEKARFLAATVLRTARATPLMLAERAGRRGSGPDPSELTPPDTPFAREVVEACAELDPMVVEHGYRSYLYARALAVRARIECDDEALFAATLLHDYAFGQMDEIDGKCFTLVGAEVAADLLAASPLAASVQRDVLDAITLHLNPSVPRSQGALQHLCHDGILVDVLGIGALKLDHAGIARVRERHPQHGFFDRGTPLLRGHARRVPGCRAAALFSAGFGTALRIGAWRERDAPAPV